jgi:hypothetical protein
MHRDESSLAYEPTGRWVRDHDSIITSEKGGRRAESMTGTITERCVVQSVWSRGICLSCCEVELFNRVDDVLAIFVKLHGRRMQAVSHN